MMETMRTLKVVINDDISAFLSNTYKPSDLTRTYTLAELGKNEKGAKRSLESICPIIEGIIKNLEKRQCIENVSSESDFGKKKDKSILQDAQDLHPFKIFDPRVYLRNNLEERKASNHETSTSGEKNVKGSLPNFFTKFSQNPRNVLSASSLVCGGEPKSKVICVGNSTHDKSTSSSVGEHMKNRNGCSIDGKNDNNYSPKNTIKKYSSPKAQNLILQDETGILHTSAASSQVSGKNNSVPKNGLKNLQAENFPLPSLPVCSENSQKNTVLPAKVLNTSRYGRPLRKRFDLSTKICFESPTFSPCEEKNLSKNILKKQSHNVADNLKEKCSVGVPKVSAACGQMNNLKNSVEISRSIKSHKCKQLLEPSNSSASESKLSGLPQNEEKQDAKNTAHVTVKENIPILRKRHPKKSDTSKFHNTATRHSPRILGKPATETKMSRYGRHLKQVTLDYRVTPSVVKELRSRVLANCSRTKLFSDSDCSDQMEEGPNLPSKAEKKHSVIKNTRKFSKKSAHTGKPPARDLHLNGKKDANKYRESKSRAAKTLTENLTVGNEAQAEPCSQKEKPAQKKSSWKNNQPVTCEPEKVTARKGTLKHLRQRHERQQFLFMQQQQQEDDAEQLLADNPHLLARNHFRMQELLQNPQSPGKNGSRNSSTPSRTVDSSSLLPMLSPMTPSGSESLGDLSFSTPRARGQWDWLKNTPATSRSGSPHYGGNCNLLLTPVVPDTSDVQRIIYHKGKGSKKTKKNLSSHVEESARLPQESAAASSGRPGCASKGPSKLHRKDKRFEWLELPNGPTPDDTNESDEEESIDQYFDDSC